LLCKCDVTFCISAQVTVVVDVLQAAFIVQGISVIKMCLLLLFFFCTCQHKACRLKCYKNYGWNGFDSLLRDALVHSTVLRLHVVCLSVCLSVTLVDQDHIGWKSWKLIARSIRPTPSLFVAQRPST